MKYPSINRKLILAHPRSGSSYLCNLIHRYYDSAYPEWDRWPPESFRIKGANVWQQMLSSPVYAFKYFSTWNFQFDYSSVRREIETHNIQVYALYRSNATNTLISQIAADNIGYLDGPPDCFFPTQWKLTNQVETVRQYYSLFDEMMDALGDTVIRTITYESLSGNGVEDLRLVDIETDTAVHHIHRVLNDEIRQDIVAQTKISPLPNYERT